jgi:hypothetical protein
VHTTDIETVTTEEPAKDDNETEIEEDEPEQQDDL